MTAATVPKLVTFDGEARSGKGTIVQITKDYLRDECGLKTMLIDRGQAFRVLVVAATRAGIDMDDSSALDAFLSEQANIDACVRFVKDVYHMQKSERDALLYTNEVGENSAKVGARPASQSFVAMLTKKWLRDAGNEGYEVVLVDGRALEQIASEMHEEGLCDYRIGLYFICDPVVGARRTLGFAATAYIDLSDQDKKRVDELVVQIGIRNERDRTRDVERLLPPVNAPIYTLPNIPDVIHDQVRPILIIDSSSELGKTEMSTPIAKLVANLLKK